MYEREIHLRITVKHSWMLAREKPPRRDTCEVEQAIEDHSDNARSKEVELVIESNVPAGEGVETSERHFKHSTDHCSLLRGPHQPASVRFALSPTKHIASITLATTRLEGDLEH